MGFAIVSFGVAKGGSSAPADGSVSRAPLVVLMMISGLMGCKVAFNKVLSTGSLTNRHRMF